MADVQKVISYLRAIAIEQRVSDLAKEGALEFAVTLQEEGEIFDVLALAVQIEKILVPKIFESLIRLHQQIFSDEELDELLAMYATTAMKKALHLSSQMEQVWMSFVLELSQDPGFVQSILYGEDDEKQKDSLSQTRH